MADILFDTEADSIRLETRKGTRIENGHGSEITISELAQAKDLVRKHPNARPRTGCSLYYNCHGLTFASRRTSVFRTADIQLILDEDGYEEVRETEVLPGDVAAYREEDGEIIHSGIVVSCPDRQLGVPMVCSKWGKGPETIHSLMDCPYRGARVSYYRVVE